MSDVTKRHRLPWRRAALAAATCTALIAAPIGASATEGDPGSTWSVAVESHDTGVRSGYQLAYANDRVYVADAQWRVEQKVIGTPENTPIESGNSMRTTFSPYGVAVDPDVDGEAVIVTTTARQRDPNANYGGGVVVYSASQGAPTDADRVFQFADGTPVLAGPRRIAIHDGTNRAFVTNLGNSRGSGPDGYITVLDLTKRGAESVIAQVTVPDAAGSVGVAVDEENNLIYVGGYASNGIETLYVIDGDEIDTSDPQNLTLNDNAITALPAVVGGNARPTFSNELKRVYVAAYDDSTITVVEADPAKDNYGEVIDVIEVTTDVDGAERGTNAVEIDAERGLLYSANLDGGVSVYDINNDHEQIWFTDENGDQYRDIPLEGRSVNFGLNKDTGEIWVSTWAGTGKVHVLSLTESAAAAISAQPEDAEADAGQTASFTVGATGAPAPAIRWQSQPVGGTWTDVPGATSASIEVVAERALDGTRYRAVLSNEHGEATSDAATLSVSYAPVVTAAPLSTTVPVGGTATFTASSQAKPAATVVWQVKAGEGDWEIVDGATSTTLTVADVTREDRGNQYRAVFVNRLGEVATAAATLAVDVPRPGTPEWDAPATTEDLLQEDAGDITGAQTGTTVTIGNIPVADDEWVQVFGYTDARYVGAHLVSGGSTTVDVSAFAVGKHHLAVFSTTGELFGYVPFEILPSGTGPTPDTDTGSKVLPDTGADLPIGLFAAGGLLVLGAGALLMVARRRSATA